MGRRVGGLVATEQTHRANVVGTPNDLPCSGAVHPEEVLVGRDSGQYLGSFTSLYLASPYFDVKYPVGWTNGTWYEQPAARAVKSCSCTDCRGVREGRVISQRPPDEEITPDDATIYDYWDHAVNVQLYTGKEGCSVRYDPDFNCFSGGTVHHGLCQPDFDAQTFHEVPACWPLSAFALANPAARIRVVTDTSGPTADPCAQDEPALEIDFAGNGAEGTTFMGEGGGYDMDRCGFDSSPDNGWGLSGRRSATDWTITDGSCWRTRFWIKGVPDNDDFVCEGYSFQQYVGFWPFTFVDVGIDGDRSIDITADWQLYDFTWRATWPHPINEAFPYPITNCPIAFITLTAAELLDQFRPFYKRQGRVHVKHVSIIPCTLSEGLHVKRYSAEVF
jgi:hypothetical protein